MSRNLKTSIVIDVAGNLEARAQRYGRAMERFSQSARAGMNRFGQSMETVGRGLDRIGNRYTALLTGAAGIGTAKMVVDLETRFTRLGIQAGKGAEEVDGLKRAIYDAAAAPDVRLDPSQVTSAVEAIVEKTGDLKFARDNLRNIALAIQATGAEGTAIGEIMAELQKMGLVDPKNVMEVIDTLNRQGKEGAFTLAHLARLGPRVVTAYTSMGRSGVGAMREMGAALQVIRMGTGSSEQAATAFEAVMRTLSDPDKIKQLRQLAGIEVFDAERLKKGERVLRPINELMVEIVKSSSGDKVKLAQVFDAEALRAFNQAASEYRRTGQLETLEKFIRLQGDGTTTMADSARMAKTASAALQNLFAAWKRFADSELTKPIQSLADALNSLDKETMDKLMQALKYGGLALGGAILLRKVGGLIGGRAGGVGPVAGGAAGGLGGGMPLPLPVYVVNKHLSLTPDAWTGAGKGAGGTAGRAGGKLRAAAAIGSSLFSLGAAGAAGYGAGTIINKAFVEGTGFGDALGRGIARILAFAGNTEAQAALASERRARGAFAQPLPALPPNLGVAVERALDRDSRINASLDALLRRSDARIGVATVKIEVEGKDGANARVTETRGRDVDVEAVSGLRVGAL